MKSLAGAGPAAGPPVLGGRGRPAAQAARPCTPCKAPICCSSACRTARSTPTPRPKSKRMSTASLPKIRQVRLQHAVLAFRPAAAMPSWSRPRPTACWRSSSAGRSLCAATASGSSCWATALLSQWSPFPGISVTTELVPQGQGHIRRHTVQSAIACTAYDCGFAVPKFCAGFAASAAGPVAEAHNDALSCTVTALQDGEGAGAGRLAQHQPVHAHTVIPAVRYDIPAGVCKLATRVEAPAAAENSPCIYRRRALPGAAAWRIIIPEQAAGPQPAARNIPRAAPAARRKGAFCYERDKTRSCLARRPRRLCRQPAGRPLGPCVLPHCAGGGRRPHQPAPKPGRRLALCLEPNTRSSVGFLAAGRRPLGLCAICVPGHIEMQGYGQIQYANTIYPWTAARA